MGVIIVSEVIAAAEETAVERFSKSVIHADNGNIEILAHRYHLTLAGESAPCTVYKYDNSRLVGHIQELFDDTFKAFLIHHILVIVDRELDEYNVRIL